MNSNDGPGEAGPVGVRSEDQVARNLILYFLIAPTANVAAIVATEGTGGGWRYVPLYFLFTSLTWIWAAPTSLAMILVDRHIKVARPILRRLVMIGLGIALFSLFAFIVNRQQLVIQLFAAGGALFGLFYRCRLPPRLTAVEDQQEN